MELTNENLKYALKLAFNKQVDFCSEIIACETYEEYLKEMSKMELREPIFEECVKAKWRERFILDEEEWNFLQELREKLC